MITESYTAAGGQKVFTFTFDLITEAYLTVTLQGVPVTDWELTAPQQVTFGASVNPLLDDVVTLSRTTPIDTPLVDFQAPAAIRAREIDLAIRQLLHNLQEQEATDEASLRKNSSGTYWESQGLPMRNLPTPVEDDEAATKGFVNGQIVGSGQLPPVGPSEAGKVLAVNSVGSGYEFAAPVSADDKRFVLALKSEASTSLNQRSAQNIAPVAGTFTNVRADAVVADVASPVEFEATPVANYGLTDAITWDSVASTVTLPVGHIYRVQMNATAHNYAASGNAGTNSAAVLQIRTPDVVGYTVFGAQMISFGAVAADPLDTPLLSGTFALDCFINTTLGAKTFIVAGARPLGADQSGLDVPSLLIVEEVQ